MNPRVQLPTGRTIALELVDLDISSQTFSYGPLDVTPYLSIEQKKSFSGYNLELANEQAYVEKYKREHGGQAPPATGSTSTLENFGNNLANEAFGAPGTVVANLKQTALIVLAAVAIWIIWKSGVFKA